MNRRRFIYGGVVLPIAAGTRMVASSSPSLATQTSSDSLSSLANRPIRERYELSLERVLHGTRPLFSPNFLLEDIQATPGRRFTEYSGDLSGRWIGALATASAADRKSV